MMARRPRLTRDKKEQIREMRERGLSCGVIARRLDISEGSARWHCLVEGIESPNTRGKVPQRRVAITCRRGNHIVRQFTAAEEQRLLELEAAGLSYGAIGRIIGRKRNSICGRLAVLARREERLLEAAE